MGAAPSRSYGPPATVGRDKLSERTGLLVDKVDLTAVSGADAECGVQVNEATAKDTECMGKALCRQLDARELFEQLVQTLCRHHAQGTFFRGCCLQMMHRMTDSSSLFKGKASLFAVFTTTASAIALAGPCFCPPELLTHSSRSATLVWIAHRAAADVWAAGVLLYCMLMGHPPFLDPAVPSACDAGARQAHMVKSIRRGSIDFVGGPAAVPARDCLDLLHRMLDPDPRKRIMIEGVLQHAWVKGEPLQDAKVLQSTGPGLAKGGDINLSTGSMLLTSR